jgi:threonine dehydrogenase-like Zn-dependent dehydrogenase
MRALFYPEWGKLRVEDVPQPILQDGEVLVRVSSCGICGSELDTFRARSTRRTPPLIMGHEFCGWVEDARNTRTHWTGGRAVIAHAMVHCGRCPACLRGDTNLCEHRQVFGMHRPGAFAEFVAVPERVLLPWPENLSGSTAVFAEPLANGVNAMRQGASGRKSRVVVIGAGPIGLMCVFAARQIYGSEVIVADRIPERVRAARLLGAALAINVLEESLADAVRNQWGIQGAEYVIDAVGSSETKNLSVNLAQPGGTIVWVGLHEDRIDFQSYGLTLHQKAVVGTYSGSMADLESAVQLLRAGKLDTSWATQFPFDEGGAAFQAMLRPEQGSIKAILRLNNDETRTNRSPH